MILLLKIIVFLIYLMYNYNMGEVIMKHNIVKMIPNTITFSRIISSLLASAFFVGGNLPIALSLYIYAAVSDAFDGLAARKLNASSEFGRILDTISDKLFVASLLFPSIILGNYLMLIPLFYESKISLINFNAKRNNQNTKTMKVGKLKTICLFPTVILGLLSCRNPICYFLLAPALIMTTKLQVSSIEAYKFQVESIKNNEEIIEDTVIYDKNKTMKENLLRLRNELIMYTECYDKIDVKRKELKK